MPRALRHEYRWTEAARGRHYAGAVDRGDDRFRIGVVFQQGVIHHARRFRTGRQIVTDIGADGEGTLTGTGQNDAAAGGVVLQLIP